MKTMVAVAPEPKPSNVEDLIAFLEIIDAKEDFDAARQNTDWRLGQAFMNVLPMEYYEILTGSLVDPFHRSNIFDLCKALDYLLEKI